MLQEVVDFKAGTEVTQGKPRLAGGVRRWENAQKDGAFERTEEPTGLRI